MDRRDAVAVGWSSRGRRITPRSGLARRRRPQSSHAPSRADPTHARSSRTGLLGGLRCGSTPDQGLSSIHQPRLGPARCRSSGRAGRPPESSAGGPSRRPARCRRDTGRAPLGSSPMLPRRRFCRGPPAATVADIRTTIDSMIRELRARSSDRAGERRGRGRERLQLWPHSSSDWLDVAHTHLESPREDEGARTGIAHGGGPRHRGAPGAATGLHATGQPVDRWTVRIVPRRMRHHAAGDPK